MSDSHDLQRGGCRTHSCSLRASDSAEWVWGLSTTAGLPVLLSTSVVDDVLARNRNSRERELILQKGCATSEACWVKVCGSFQETRSCHQGTNPLATPTHQSKVGYPATTSKQQQMAQRNDDFWFTHSKHVRTLQAPTDWLTALRGLSSCRSFLALFS